ncbi:MAG: hypothetical protein NTY01_10915 [Verrucomicrobia bacterium]|nr:hypothetical protein [Verrucomicrobiota bacterium]
MNPTMRSAERASILRKLRWLLGLFTTALIFSGLTAFPLKSEMEHVVAIRGLEHVAPAEAANGFDRWILTVRGRVRESYTRYPWLACGTDWLAFAPNLSVMNRKAISGEIVLAVTTPVW